MQTQRCRAATFAVAALATLASVSRAQQDSDGSAARRTPRASAPIPSVAQARAIEKNDALPITDFYSTPARLGRPGELLRSREFADYRFGNFQPGTMGIRAVRILYTSQDARGKLVPASGVVLVPYGEAPSGGWPVIVWAHGTSGVGRPFAPSLMKDLYYGWQELAEWPMLGYAVVAPDYAGLGTDVPHQYLVGDAQGNDLINALPAARQAVPELGRRWVMIGHSQGGAAVLSAAELLNDSPDPDFLGTVGARTGCGTTAGWSHGHAGRSGE